MMYGVRITPVFACHVAWDFRLEPIVTNILLLFLPLLSSTRPTAISLISCNITHYTAYVLTYVKCPYLFTQHVTCVLQFIYFFVSEYTPFLKDYFHASQLSIRKDVCHTLLLLIANKNYNIRRRRHHCRRCFKLPEGFRVLVL